MIKIAHEAPLSIMERMREVTDYDYALACLFDKIPGYYEFFEKSVAYGRVVLLDNGVFEDGVPMEAAKYVEWIEKLKPTEYIVPDEFDKASVTIENFANWRSSYKDLPGKAIGVVQGTTLDQMIAVYEFMASYADKIAINFASVYYQDVINGDNWDERAVHGRFRFINHLITQGIYAKNKPHHLLGCSLPKEYDRLATVYPYRDGKTYIDYFESMDTSAPVIWGLLTGRYPDDLGTIAKKNKTKLKDLITADVSHTKQLDIEYNVAKFREYLRSK
jgi:hypothetical protein